MNSRRAAAIVLASIALYIGLLLYHTAPYNYNLSMLLRIGASNQFFTPSALEPGLVVFNDPQSGGDGYDGQFYYYMIKNLFMGEKGFGNPFRYQRLLYPLLAYIVALGRPGLIPLSMFLVNLAAIAASAFLLWKLIRDSTVRAQYLLLYTLNIGFLIAVFYDVATPLCVGFLVAGVYFYVREKMWLAASMLALSMLAQENAGIVLATLAAWLVWKKNWRGAFTLGTAVLPWAAWQAFLWSRYGDLPLVMSGNHFRLPFVGMISQIASMRLHGGLTANLRELSVYPMMIFVVVLLIVSISEMSKRPSVFALVLLFHALVGISFNKEQIWSSAITSPARALASVFPFLLVCYARERSAGLRLLIILSAVLALLGIARILLMPSHPFYVT